jgi:signal transduction histidine kinase
LRQRVAPADLFEEAISLDLGTAAGQNVKIIRQLEAIAPVPVDRHKVLQILINLLSNAKRAVQAAGCPDKQITIATRMIGSESGERLVFQVIDNGAGIEPANLTRIFSHGFTTREDGHGFGLHGSANMALEMNGSLNAASDGVGRGSCFTLEVPLVASSDLEELITRKRVA